MERTLVINQHLISLAIIREAKYCDKCQRNSQMRLLIKRNDYQTFYCHICAVNLLNQLAERNLQFISKERRSLVENQIIIEELRTELNKKLWVDYYVSKKPYCVSCLNSGIGQQEYRFCADDCLVNSWMQYQGHNYLKNHG